MASPHPSVQVVEEFRVSPPSGSIAEGSVPLTSFDLIWVYSDPVERLFFYPFPHPTASFVDSHLPNLMSSLSLTLQHYYPLAGTVRRTPNTDDRFEIYYADGDTVAFTVAVSDDDFHLLSAGGKRDFARIQPLIPRLSAVDDDTRISLFAVQATMFPDNGVCIGVTIHHSAGDGTSTVGFLKAWASTCKSGGLAPPPPIYDRALIPQPPELYSSQYKLMMVFRALQFAASAGLGSQANSVAALFTLGLPHVQYLKQRVAASATQPVRCSTFVVSCAHVWACLIKTRGFDSHKTAHFLFPVDIRGRLDTPVPVSYFGNCLAPCFVEANVGDLIGEHGIVVASVALGKAIEGLLNGGVMRDAEGWEKKIRSIMAEQPMSLAGSPKFRVYDIDFGWGRPWSVEIPSIKKTGAISLAEAREDGGGVEIGLSLDKHEMDEFESYFYSGFENHQNEH